MARQWIAMVLVGMAAVGLVGGCNDNEVSPLGAGGAGQSGSAGASGSGGSAASAGSAGTDGGAGSGGSAGTDGGAGSGGGGAGTGGSAGAGGAGGTSGAHLLVAGTDFTTTTEIASIDLASMKVTGRLTVSDGDAVPAASGGLGFVLERTNDKVDLLAQDGTLDKSIDLAQAGSGDAGSGSDAGSDAGDAGAPAGGDPVGVVVVPGATPDAGSATTRAYVPLYDENRVAVLDLAAGAVSHNLDLSGYLDSSDGDGSVDAGNAVYDPQSGRLYLTLQRIDRTTIVPPDYQLACPAVPSLLVAFDTKNDTEVDLNGSAPGKALQLTTVDPVSAVLDQGKLVILSAGCFDKSDAGATRVKQGVESIDLSTGQSSMLYQPGNDDFLARMLRVATGQMVIDRWDASYAEHFNRYSVASAALGAELSGVPQGVCFDGSGGLFGVTTTSGDGGTSVQVVRYDLNAQTSTTLLSSPWQSGVTSAAGSALVQ